MRSPIGSLKNVKIFVLYLMDNINYPLEYSTINDIVMQTDYVLYLDFAEAFISMQELGLIEKIEEDEYPYIACAIYYTCVANYDEEVELRIICGKLELNHKVVEAYYDELCALPTIY